MKKIILILILLFGGYVTDAMAGIDVNGDDDGILCGQDSSLAMTEWMNTTVCGLVAIDDQSTDRDFASYLQSSGRGLELRFDTGDDTWHFNGYDGSWQYAKYDLVTPPTNGVWYLVCGVVDDGTMKVYQNGVVGSVTDTTAGFTELDSTAEFALGWYEASARKWDGKISWVCLWDTVLTADQMVMMASSKIKNIALQVEPDNIQGYWLLDTGIPGGGIVATYTNYLVTDDARLDQSLPDTNIGTEESAVVAVADRMVFRADLSSIPTGTEIIDARLMIYENTRGGQETLTIYAIDVDRDWVETETTFNIWKTGNSWTVAGCDSDGNDYDSTYTYTAPNGNSQWVDFDITTWVQAYVDGVVATDQGFRLSGAGGFSNSFRTAEYTGDIGERPYIKVLTIDAQGVYRDFSGNDNHGIGRDADSDSTNIGEHFSSYP